MAQSKQDTYYWGVFSGCGYSNGCYATEKLTVGDSWSWSRDTSNCEYAWATVNVTMNCSGSWLGWASEDGIVRLATRVDYFDGNSGVYDNTQGKGGRCHSSFNYKATHSSCRGHVRAGTTTLAYWMIFGFTPTSSGADWQWDWTFDATLPNNMKVLPPTTLSANWPTSLAGSASATLGSWSTNTNIGGKPTTYTNAKIWNWRIEILDSSGNYLGQQLLNTNETKSATWSTLGTGFYTANALVGSTAANNSKIALTPGGTYKLRITANNNMNQSIQTTSGNYTVDIPTPTVSITSIIYDPSTKDSILTFDWRKATSAVDEKITYVVKQGSTTLESGTLVASTGGAAKSGTKTITGIPTGEEITVTVTNTSGSQSKSATAKEMSPVANAAFLGFEWDDVRRTCTIRAEAPGAPYIRICAGYSANVYDISNNRTAGSIGSLVVKDLNHGTGQVMYLQAVPEATNGYQFVNEIAKVSVPIPNPIIGVRTAADKKQYIVDVVEHKSGGTVTTKWQNGDRIVKKP